MTNGSELERLGVNYGGRMEPMKLGEYVLFEEAEKKIKSLEESEGRLKLEIERLKNGNLEKN